LSGAGLPGPAPTPVVYDVNVLVMAVADGDSAFRSWPPPPPASSNRSAGCLGIVNDPAEFALWLWPHILSDTGRVLAGVIGMPAGEADEYISILAEIAQASGGGLDDPPQSAGDCPDWEGNRVLDLAEAAGAFLIVSDDTGLIAMSPWRGRPIISPDKFAALVDASRRASRRRRSGP
jgi:hypothetical protein